MPWVRCAGLPAGLLRCPAGSRYPTLFFPIFFLTRYPTLCLMRETHLEDMLILCMW